MPRRSRRLEKKKIGLTMGQNVEQTEEFPADSPRGRHSRGQENDIDVMVMLVRFKLRLDGPRDRAIRLMKLVAQVHVDYDVPNTSKVDILLNSYTWRSCCS